MIENINKLKKNHIAVDDVLWMCFMSLLFANILKSVIGYRIPCFDIESRY